jgi:putative peptide zinc metalloprotease protein
MLPFQLLIFMRTDVYFVVQDLAGCANLYADGSAYIHYLAHRVRHLDRCTGDPPSDPTRALPPHERRAVHAYSWLLLCGTTMCITVAVFVTIPTVVALLTQLIEELAGGSLAGVLDGTAALLASGSIQILWARAWWLRHSDQVRDYLHARKRRSSRRR